MSDLVRDWGDRAREDLAAAPLALDARWWGSVCFHAQQAPEKWIKALLTLQGQPPPRVHGLGALADQLAAVYSVESIREATLVLTEYGVGARYPRLELGEEEMRRKPCAARSTRA